MEQREERKKVMSKFNLCCANTLDRLHDYIINYGESLLEEAQEAIDYEDFTRAERLTIQANTIAAVGSKLTEFMVEENKKEVGGK
jgi:hypothetical protein